MTKRLTNKEIKERNKAASIKMTIVYVILFLQIHFHSHVFLYIVFIINFVNINRKK